MTHRSTNVLQIKSVWWYWASSIFYPRSVLRLRDSLSTRLFRLEYFRVGAKTSSSLIIYHCHRLRHTYLFSFLLCIILVVSYNLALIFFFAIRKFVALFCFSFCKQMIHIFIKCLFSFVRHFWTIGFRFLK